jgi:hypothetical protein
MEQNISMKMASAFWREIMFEYDWNHHIVLPHDRQRNSDERRSGRAYTVSFTFDDNTAKVFINYASATDASLLTLFLTCYYVFLFKLTQTETDFCVAMNMNSRYKPEWNNIVGAFVNL